MRRMTGRIEALEVVALGLLGIWLATLGPYTRVMAEPFRWVTISGFALVLAIGLALLTRPRARPHWSAASIFGALGLVIVVGRPFADDVAPTVVPDLAPSPSAREGYADLPLYEIVERNFVAAPGAKVSVAGFVHRTPELDERGEILVLYPKMACCIADALAVGVRVAVEDADASEAGAWVRAYGVQERIDPPSPVPSFRVGAILFTTIAEDVRLVADEIAPLRSTLPPVVEFASSERSAGFLSALEATGIAAELEGQGPFTVFVPMDVGFEAVRSLDGAALAEHLRSFIVPGDLMEQSLYEETELTSLAGRTLRVAAENGRLRVEGARILFGDQVARNGVVHLVHPAWPVEADASTEEAPSPPRSERESSR